MSDEERTLTRAQATTLVAMSRAPESTVRRSTVNHMVRQKLVSMGLAERCEMPGTHISGNALIGLRLTMKGRSRAAELARNGGFEQRNPFVDFNLGSARGGR